MLDGKIPNPMQSNLTSDSVNLVLYQRPRSRLPELKFSQIDGCPNLPLPSALCFIIREIFFFANHQPFEANRTPLLCRPPSALACDLDNS